MLYEYPTSRPARTSAVIPLYQQHLHQPVGRTPLINPSVYRQMTPMIVVTHPHARPETTHCASRIVATITLLLALNGCASSGTIRESQLDIVPTEATSSFSGPSQVVIGELGLTPDTLADPSTLEGAASLQEKPPATRALLLSESWFLRGQNDIDVPIATSLDRFLRAAHYAYDALFAESVCADLANQQCKDLMSSYNRSAIEVARLTRNGTTLPSPNETTYVVERFSDNGQLDLSEWEVSIDEDPAARAHATLGAPGVGCQVATAGPASADSTTGGVQVRHCTPAAFVVSFEDRADKGRSRAHLRAYDTFSTRTLTLHNREFGLPVDDTFTWNQLLAPAPALSLAASCFGPHESALPTVFLVLPISENITPWSTIGSTLSAENNLREHYNFCSLAALGGEDLTDPIQRIMSVLNTASEAPSPRPTVVLVTQGADGEALLRAVKSTVKSQRPRDSTPGMLLAGSLIIPLFPQSQSTDSVESPHHSPSTRAQQAALSDIKRLLSRLIDSEDGALSGSTRGALSKTPGLNLSPVM